jgi:hypothetical protein
MPAPWFRRLGLAAAAGWVAAAVMLDLHAVVFGNATRLHGGLSPLASPDARSFYQGEWLELHDACQAIVADGLPGPVCTTSQKHKYILAFTRRTVCDYPPTGPVAYILTEAGRQPGIPTEVERGAVPLVLGARYSVYRVGAVPRGAEPNRAAAPSPADSR